jgi:hypothetical protein
MRIGDAETFTDTFTFLVSIPRVRGRGEIVAGLVAGALETGGRPEEFLRHARQRAANSGQLGTFLLCSEALDALASGDGGL